MELRKITKEELDKIIEDHQHYLNHDITGWSKMRATIYGVEIEGYNLTKVNLENAFFKFVKFKDVDLSNADLSSVEIYDSEFESVCFYYTNLSFSLFTRVTFQDNKFYQTNLNRSIINFADFTFEEFDNCLFYLTDIYFSNLLGVKFIGSDLRETRFILSDLKCVEDKTQSISTNTTICPEVGSFIGYKQASGKIIKLNIPSSAKRLSYSSSRICKCDKAKVLAIENIDGTRAKETKVSSDHDPDFIYELGKTVKADKFDDDKFNEYTNGIHFYITREEAVNYKTIFHTIKYITIFN